ncbi:BatD family protein [Algoriphagus namhaensis]
MKIKAILSILILMSCSQLQGMAQQFHTEVRLNKSSVYVGEPIEVTIGVYTTTWFTRGVDLGNLNVPGAFTVYFRPVSQSKTLNGKQFTGVELIYNVFPYDEDEFVFPSLEIEVESPAEGDFKGKKHTLRSPERKVTVKPIPAEFSQEDWLVAQALNVRENWSGNRNEVKVGDVLVRQISRNAAGTVSELIPPVSWDSIPGVSIYPARSEVENTKTKSAISATRQETVRYLFEKEGEVTIPEQVFTWYNPYQKKLYKRTLKSNTLNVKPNPDLGVLLSVRDSLQAEVQLEQAELEEEGPLLIFGLPWKRFAVLLIGAVISLMVFFFVGKKLFQSYRQKRLAYLHSELYFFRKFKNSLRSPSRSETLTAFYRWIDEIHLEEPSLDFFVKKYGSLEMKKAVSKGPEQVFALGPAIWDQARKNYMTGDPAPASQSKNLVWINPS